MAETPRVYPGRPLIAMSVSGYEQGAWKDAALNWIVTGHDLSPRDSHFVSRRVSQAER
jgi:hypothetical protein